LLNWAGNYRYGAQRITSATSLAQVQEFVRRHGRFKVLGTRHCFNGIADSSDDFLSLREMKQVLELDRAARTVTVESGMSYGQLCPYLDQQGFSPSTRK
jgi:xylitol oxidase